MTTNYREAVACLEEFRETLHGHSQRKFTNLLDAVRQIVNENTAEIESKTEDVVLKRVLDWCTEMSRDHHEYDVYDLDSNNVYKISKNGVHTISSVSRKAIQYYTYNKEYMKYYDEIISLESELTGLFTRRPNTAFNDLLYSDEKIYVFSPHTTLKRIQRLTLCGCISETIRNGTFNYYEY